MTTRHVCNKCGEIVDCEVPDTADGQKWKQISDGFQFALLILLIIFIAGVCNSNEVAKIIHG